MEQELERMVAAREARKRSYAEKQMRGEMSAQAVIQANDYIKRLLEQEEAQENAIEGQKSVVAQRELSVQQAREDLVTASQELKALEKHREKWQDKVKKERQKKEEENLDELAQTIFLGQSRK